MPLTTDVLVDAGFLWDKAAVIEEKAEETPCITVYPDANKNH
jgi:hypothetical protein